MEFFPKLRQSSSGFLKRMREYSRISHSAEIGRRYFATNAFDGILTVLGILFGGFVGNLRDPSVIVITGLGASVAMGVSGFWGTYEAEKAERTLALKELERHTISNLEDTAIGRAARFATVYVSFIDGIAPFLFALVVISPFLFFAHLFDVTQMYFVAFGLAFLSLAALGVFLGSVSGGNKLLTGAKMVLAGVICSVLSILLIGGAA